MSLSVQIESEGCDAVFFLFFVFGNEVPQKMSRYSFSHKMTTNLFVSVYNLFNFFALNPGLFHLYESKFMYRLKL